MTSRVVTIPELNLDNITEYWCEHCNAWLDSGETLVDNKGIRVCIIHGE